MRKREAVFLDRTSSERYAAVRVGLKCDKEAGWLVGPKHFKKCPQYDTCQFNAHEKQLRYQLI